MFSAVVSGVVGAWAQHLFDSDRDAVPPAASQQSAATAPTASVPGGSGSPASRLDADLHCATRAQVLGSVQWWPCARLGKSTVTFGLVASNNGDPATLHLRLGYVRAQEPASCGPTDADVSVAVGQGVTTWYTVPGCSVDLIPGAVQAAVRVGGLKGALSTPALSPTLHIQQDGSVIDPTRGGSS
ncbi:hypothetical protein [Streptomyces sp. NPDC047869]|uniref:hypothetical protein n=1 Tax=Streptomyces sp. NPDC047869 TaxID=3154709 RepID=UPI003455E524